MLARRDESIRVFLFYGPDEGLVGERAAALCAAVVLEVADPFQLVRLEGNELASDPMRLVDEANTIGLFGGKRAIRVSHASRSLTLAVEPLLATPPLDAIVVLEGADLPRTHGLRVLIERAKSAWAIPCFGDQSRNLDDLVAEVLGSHGLAIEANARSLLLSRLGADRRQSRGELEKLALFAFGRRQVSRADVEEIVGDASARDMDDVVDAVFAGVLPDVDAGFSRLLEAGQDPSVLLGSVLRHGVILLAARIQIDSSRAMPADVVTRMRGVPFTRRASIEAALKRRSSEDISLAVGVLHDAIGRCRRTPQLGRQLAVRALWNIAASGARV